MQHLQRRWDAANAGLDALRRQGDLNPDNPSPKEDELLAELDHVEYEEGMRQRMQDKAAVEQTK